jgi:hypothetical protein
MRLSGMGRLFMGACDCGPVKYGLTTDQPLSWAVGSLTGDFGGFPSRASAALILNDGRRVQGVISDVRADRATFYTGKRTS